MSGDASDKRYGCFVISKTVSEVKSPRFVRRLEKAVQEVWKEFEASWPDQNAEVWFHNSERGWDFGGWTTGNYPTKIDQSSLFYNQGAVYYDHDQHKVRVDLAPRKMGSLFGLIGRERLKDFVRRAAKEAISRIDDGRFFRNYRSEGRFELVALKLLRVLKEAGIDGIECGVVQVPYQMAMREYNAALLMVDPGQMAAAKKLLTEQCGCKQIDEPDERSDAMAFDFDDLQVRVVPHADLGEKLFRTEPNVWRTPLIYHFARSGGKKCGLR